MVFDGHSDILFDVTRRRLLGEQCVLTRRHLDRLRQGGVEGLILALWTGGSFWDTADPLRRLELMLSCAQADLAQCPEFHLVRTAREAEAARAGGKIYVFLSVEGLAPIEGDLGRLEWLRDAGVTSAMLTWNEENRLAAGAGADPKRGLTPLGREALRRMDSLGMALDVSHLGEQSFWDALDAASPPILASHSNCFSLCPVPRNLTDAQLTALRDAGGVVGLNSYRGFLHRDPACQTAEALVCHARHMAEVMGLGHVACGFDFCHFMGPGNESGAGLETAAQIPAFFRLLRSGGWGEAELAALGRENLLGMFPGDPAPRST